MRRRPAAFSRAIDPDAGAENFLTETTARDDGVIFFTSGTSDTPKGVVLSYREQLANIMPMTEGFGITGDDRIYDFRSFNWASAQLLGVLAPLARGATLVMAKKFSATRFFDDVRTHGVTVAAGNPTVINMLLASPIKIGPQDVPSLRFLTSSSAPLLPQEWRRFEERFGIPVAQGYGSSETAWIAVNPGHARRFGSVGRPLAYHRLAIVGADGRAVPPGETGHVELGAWDDNDFRYLGDDGSVRVNSRGRMRTGDIGYLDADGYLYLTGREKELIIRGGVNISPVEIDGVLMQRAEVSEAATIGVPDAIWGEEVVSYVVLAPGSPVCAGRADALLRRPAHPVQGAEADSPARRLAEERARQARPQGAGRGVDAGAGVTRPIPDDCHCPARPGNRRNPRAVDVGETLPHDRPVVTGSPGQAGR